MTVNHYVEIENDRVINLLILPQRCLRQDQGEESPCRMLQMLDLWHISEERRLL